MKKFVFVLMPFQEDFDDVYMMGIKTACQSDFVYCERSDEQIYEGNILERIYNQIQHADFIVADLTGKNPNVFYEVGYAHALGKKVILITQNPKDIPFDLYHYNHIVYDRTHLYQLNEKLKNRLNWYLEHEDLPRGTDIRLNYYINNTLLRENTRVESELALNRILGYDGTVTGLRSSFHVLVENPTEQYCRMEDIQISLNISHPLEGSGVYKSLYLPDGSYLIPVEKGAGKYDPLTIFPKAYIGKEYEYVIKVGRQQKIDIPDRLTGAIHVYTPFEKYIYPFTMILRDEWKKP